MKKIAKVPRKFGRRKVKIKSMKQQQSQSRVLNDKTIEFLDWMSPGFARYYRESYDNEGNYVGQRMPGLFG